MMRVERVITLAAVLVAMGWVGSALAMDSPDVPNSTLQGGYIAVQGYTNGIPDNCSDGRCGNYTVTIRTATNRVMPGIDVMLDFSSCPDIRIACDQLLSFTGQTLVGATVVHGVTNALGQFTFKIVGTGLAQPVSNGVTSQGTAAGVPCARFSAQGVLFPTALVVAAYDVNGVGTPGSAVNGADVALVVGEVLAVALGAEPRARDDYNRSNSINGADGAYSARLALDAALGTGSQDTGPFCP